MEHKRAKVFLVDDYAPMRESLHKLLDLENDFEVCGEAESVERAFEGIVTSHPDVAVVDLVLNRQTGFELLKRLGGLLKNLPVLILTMLPESLNAEAALQLGARGYIMKSESPDKILEALRKVLKGRVYVSPAMAQKLQPKEEKPHE